MPAEPQDNSTEAYNFDAHSDIIKECKNNSPEFIAFAKEFINKMQNSTVPMFKFANNKEFARYLDEHYEMVIQTGAFNIQKRDNFDIAEQRRQHFDKLQSVVADPDCPPGKYYFMPDGKVYVSPTDAQEGLMLATIPTEPGQENWVVTTIATDRVTALATAKPGDIINLEADHANFTFIGHLPTSNKPTFDPAICDMVEVVLKPHIEAERKKQEQMPAVYKAFVEGNIKPDLTPIKMPQLVNVPESPAALTLEQAVAVLNEHKHEYPDSGSAYISEWVLEQVSGAEIVYLIRYLAEYKDSPGQRSERCIRDLTEFEAIAVAEKYLREAR